MKYKIEVTRVDGSSVEGTCDGKPWLAEPFFWGGKVLLKVVPEMYGQFQQGEKVAIGQAAKSAIRAGGGTIPEAPQPARMRKEQAPAVPDRIAALEAQIAALMALVEARGAPQTPESEVAPSPWDVEAEPPRSK